MKFHLHPAGGHTITAFGPGWVRIGSTEYRQNLLIGSERVITDWASGGFAALAERDFAGVLELDPEVVLLGTGSRQQFPHPRLYRALTDAGVGVEVMDTGAACRTFNILAGEGRRVAAALLIA